MSVAVQERQVETRRADGSGRVALWFVVAGWTAVLGLLLRHREVISSDTLSNYIHVWYVADHVWNGQGVPLHMPVLGHGEALAFPYGFVPWMTAVLLWPLMHEWSVTFCLGLGFVLLVAATFWAFPEVRKGWWAVGTLLNPALAMGLLLGQLPFMWAAAMFLAAIGCWRRGRRTSATVLAALAQLTHAPILVPLVALTVFAYRRHEPDRSALVKRWLVSVLCAAPAIVLVFASPVAGDTHPLLGLWIEVETLCLRALVIIVPVGMVLLQRRELPTVHRRVAMRVVGLMLLGQIAIAFGAGMRVGWGSMFREPRPGALALTRSQSFEPGKTYRVLSQGDGKYAPYAAVRGGAKLDSEFFPESLYWRSFPDVGAYSRFLHQRQVDFVAIYNEYAGRRTNEKELLETLAADSGAACRNDLRVTVAEQTSSYELFRVDRRCSG
ncbi:MAG: hypothetical protein QOJ67_2749 [Acidimicrobiaceae bacterium]